MATETRSSWLEASPRTAPIIQTKRLPAQTRDGYTVPERITVEMGGIRHAPEVVLQLTVPQAQELMWMLRHALDSDTTTTEGASDGTQA